MKNSLSICLAFLLLLVLAGACKKTAGPGGKNSIGGAVYYKTPTSSNDEPAPMATVSIAYGTDQPTTSFDQTILANSDGTYKFEGLQKGKYYIEAKYTDSHGFNYSAGGGAVEFHHKKKHAEITFVLE